LSNEGNRCGDRQEKICKKANDEEGSQVAPRSRQQGGGEEACQRAQESQQGGQESAPESGKEEP
jgi:hypothetical protein